MSIDIYLCSVTTSDDLRAAMGYLCAERWSMESGIRLWPIDEQFVNCSAMGFQRMRRIVADQEAESDVYVVTDDDYLLPPDFDLAECVRVFKESGFATLSLMPSNCTINEWTPEGYITENTPDVMEHVSAGGVRFCRKGHLTHWPEMKDKFPGYDAIHAEAIRANGGRVGLFRNHKALHLGEGYSSIWMTDKMESANA